MLRIINVLLSFVVAAGVTACCCPCGRMPIFQPVRVPVPVPQPQPQPFPGDGFAVDGKKKNADPNEEAVKQVGGGVKRDDGQPDRPVVEVTFNFTQVSDGDLKKLAGFTRLRKLVLTQNEKITGAGLQDLKGLQDLEYLDVSGSRQFNDQGMKHAAAFKNLKFLNVSNTKLTEAGMREIAGLEQLEQLTASGMLLNGPGQNEPTDMAIQELGRLKQLRKLELSNTQLGDLGMAAFDKLPQLQELTIGHQVTDAGVM